MGRPHRNGNYKTLWIPKAMDIFVELYVFELLCDITSFALLWQRILYK
jgi:hypothetical protein